jgi:hypothetical protein
MANLNKNYKSYNNNQNNDYINNQNTDYQNTDHQNASYQNNQNIGYKNNQNTGYQNTSYKNNQSTGYRNNQNTGYQNTSYIKHQNNEQNTSYIKHQNNEQNTGYIKHQNNEQNTGNQGFYKKSYNNETDIYQKSAFDTISDNVIMLVKETILDYLYNKIEISDHRYVIIKNISDIYKIKNEKYYVSSNSCGINSLIIFMKKDNNFYSYLIDRRSISYNKQSLNKSKVRFIEIKLAVDLKLYDGTIFDGILIDKVSTGDTSNNEKLSFIITDVFTFNGKSIITMDYKKKMYYTSECIKEFIIDNKNNDAKYKNNIKLYISKPFEINQINQLLKEYIVPNVQKYNIKGISFYPVNSGIKLIYLFDKQDEKIKNDLQNNIIENNIQESGINELKKLEEEQGVNYVMDSSEINKKKIIYKYDIVNIECCDNITTNLEMKKTIIPDVYKLFGIFLSGENYIKKKIGIAYIPSFKLSLEYKTLFMNREVIIVNCKLNINKHKWIPLNEAPEQKIDIINMDKRYKIIEEIQEDNDDLILDE